MIELDLKFILSLSVSLLPAILAVIKFKQMDKAYYPFAFCLWLAPVTEVISYLYAINTKTEANIISNTYLLIEFILLVTLFNNWGIFNKNSKTYLFCLLAGIIIWLPENIIVSNINNPNPYFKIAYSFTLVFLSISMINAQVFKETDNILKSSKFLISSGILILYIFYMLVIFFNIDYLFKFEKVFFSRVYLIVTYVNAFINIIYLMAIIWIPKKINFTTRF
jgi:hypothetical protein